jgi:hypothetical protein
MKMAEKSCGEKRKRFERSDGRRKKWQSCVVKKEESWREKGKTWREEKSQNKTEGKSWREEILYVNMKRGEPMKIVKMLVRMEREEIYCSWAERIVRWWWEKKTCMSREEVLVRIVSDCDKEKPAWAERKHWWGLLVIVRKEDLHKERGRAGVIGRKEDMHEQRGRAGVIGRNEDLHEQRGKLVRTVSDSEKGRASWGERKSWWGLLVIVRKEGLHDQRGRTGEDC